MIATCWVCGLTQLRIRIDFAREIMFGISCFVVLHDRNDIDKFIFEIGVNTSMYANIFKCMYVFLAS